VGGEPVFTKQLRLLRSSIGRTDEIGVHGSQDASNSLIIMTEVPVGTGIIAAAREDVTAKN
jgi:hypothetical protein